MQSVYLQLIIIIDGAAQCGLLVSNFHQLAVEIIATQCRLRMYSVFVMYTFMFGHACCIVCSCTFDLIGRHATICFIYNKSYLQYFCLFLFIHSHSFIILDDWRWLIVNAMIYHDNSQFKKYLYKLEFHVDYCFFHSERRTNFFVIIFIFNANFC